MNTCSKSEKTNDPRIIKMNEVSAPIINDLHLIGLDVNFVEDLYNIPLYYESAIPILIKWLPIIDFPDVKDEIIRALSVKWAKGTQAQKVLINEFRKEKEDSSLRWSIGNALYVVSDKSVQNELVSLVQDREYGRSRQMIVMALGRMDKDVVEPVLLSLLNDSDVIGHAIYALGSIRSIKALSLLEEFTTCKNTYIRNEAKKAIAKITKSKA